MKNNMDYIKDYAKFLRGSLKVRRPLKVVIDCSNGTTGPVLDRLLSGSPDIRYTLLNARPDGNFPAHGPNPLAKGADAQLRREVRRRKADLGIIFDADGDRVFFADDLGRPVDAHEIGFALMQLFRPPYVVSTIASRRLKKVRGAVISPVGHYFFKNIMRRKKASVGLEHSGHFYYRKFFYCDSGILTAIEIMNFVSGLRGGFSEWLDSLPEYFRSGEINFKVADKKTVLAGVRRTYGRKADAVSDGDGLTFEFKDWWFNLRPSNTENLLRLNLEADDRGRMKKELAKLKKIITT